MNAEARRRGILAVASAAILWSTAGLFVRMIDLDTWTLVLWRSIFSALALGAVFLMENRGRLVASMAGSGWPGVVTVVLIVVSTISYVMALRLTTVANVMTVYAALPFIATGLAFAFLRERVTRRFVVAGSAALAGIALTAGVGASSRDLWGLIAALVMTAGFAGQIINTKRRDPTGMTFLVAMSAVACIALVAPLASSTIPTPAQLLACALYGVLTTGVAYVLALKGSRLISAGEAGLISMLDMALAPLWVWIICDEVPSTATLLGGAVVLASVLWYLVTGRNGVGLVSCATGSGAQDAPL